MTDRELLELAAKAAGYKIADVETKDCLALIDENGYWGDEHYYWNPLADDGDALRLAVKLELAISIDFDRVGVAGNNGGVATEYLYDKPVPTDPYAATRRAIVRAAAEIGKNL